jgi:leucyl-tRNA synthetase
VVPHITDRLWTELGYGSSAGAILNAPWPVVDASALTRETIDLMLQINGKLRGSLSIAASASQEEITAAALSHESLAKFGEGRPVKKAIVVPGRLVNIVV